MPGGKRSSLSEMFVECGAERRPLFRNSKTGMICCDFWASDVELLVVCPGKKKQKQKKKMKKKKEEKKKHRSAHRLAPRLKRAHPLSLSKCRSVGFLAHKM